MLWLRFSHFQYPKFYFQYSKFHFPYSSYSIALHCNSIAMRFSHSIIYAKIFSFSVLKLQFSSFQITFPISKLSNSLAPNNNSIAIYVLSNRFSHLIICIKKFPFFPLIKISFSVMKIPFFPSDNGIAQFHCKLNIILIMETIHWVEAFNLHIDYLYLWSFCSLTLFSLFIVLIP